MTSGGHHPNMLAANKSQPKIESHPTLESIIQSLQAQQENNVIETLKELGDGMQAKIYLARDSSNR